MNLIKWNGVWLVDLARDTDLMAFTTVYGAILGPPRWVECIADGDDDWPAQRISAVRRQGESCESLMQRVMQAIRDLKRVRGFQYPVRMFCMHTDPPADPEQADRRFNIKHFLRKEAEGDDPRARVEALDMLRVLHEHRGPLPPFKVQ
jgi:hypothetical protein